MTKPQIDWKNLGFSYFDTGAFVKAVWRNGEWSEPQVCTEPYFNIHIAATALNYGQACFEGLKAFSNRDGSINAFRPAEHARRMINTAQRLVMQAPPEELFLAAVALAVQQNRDFVPPYGTGASLYIRPLLLGTGPCVGVRPSEEYTFLVYVVPIGPYYKNGFYPVSAYVQENYDRAAPLGVGHIKAAGNYAAGLQGDIESKEKGFPICLYLDSKSRTFIDEFGTSNFIGITPDNRYVTPQSTSILPSITNKSLMTMARDFGLSVEQRPIRFDELPNFAEVGACGTAAVITPVYSITRGDQVLTFGKENEGGEVLKRLYQEIQGIQYGEIEDRYGWLYRIA